MRSLIEVETLRDVPCDRVMKVLQHYETELHQYAKALVLHETRGEQMWLAIKGDSAAAVLFSNWKDGIEGRKIVSQHQQTHKHLPSMANCSPYTLVPTCDVQVVGTDRSTVEGTLVTVSSFSGMPLREIRFRRSWLVRLFLSWFRKSIFAGSHTTNPRTRLQPLRLSILAVFIAAVFSLSQTAFYISTSRDLYLFNFLLVKSDVSSTIQNDLPRVWNTTQCFNISSCLSLHSTSTDEQVPNSSNRFVMLFGIWERMINAQSALNRLVLLGVDAGFTMVKPFFYESNVSPHYAFPEQFEFRYKIPQPATLYSQTQDLYNTKHLFHINITASTFT